MLTAEADQRSLEARKRFDLDFPSASVKAFVEKADDGSDRMVIEGIASSTVEDRMGDVISQKAMSVMQKQAGGMTVFLNHDYDVPEDVFGTIETAMLKTASDKEQGTCQDLVIRVLVDGDNPRAAKTFQLIKNGRKVGFSIGARVKEWEPLDDKNPWGGMEIKDVELVEISVVGIPANQRAMIDSIARGLRKRLGMPDDPDRAASQKSAQLDLLEKNVDVEKAGRTISAATASRLQKCMGLVKAAQDHGVCGDSHGHLTECYKELEAMMPGGGDDAQADDANVGEPDGERALGEFVQKKDALESTIGELTAQKMQLDADRVALVKRNLQLLDEYDSLQQMIAVAKTTVIPRATRPTGRVATIDARSRSLNA